MNTNVGMADRLVRLVVGAALIAFAFGVIFPNTGFNWLGWIGVIPILTAAVGLCPLYSMLGVSTVEVVRS